MQNIPRVSIITTVYNASTTLEATILSVVNQKSDFIEYIIIDGGSYDGSVGIIELYNSYIDFWISEKDEGIYDAMNKGVSQANGKWVYFLGADDKLNEGILSKLSDKFESDLAVIYGDVIYDTGYEMHSRLGRRMLLENTLHHQGAFYDRNLFTNFRYDTKYGVSSDYELNLQIYLRQLPSLYVPKIIAVCGSTGVSSKLSSKETNRIRGKYITNPFCNFTYSLVLDIYYLYFKLKKKIKYILVNSI